MSEDNRSRMKWFYWSRGQQIQVLGIILLYFLSWATPQLYFLIWVNPSNAILFQFAIFVGFVTAFFPSVFYTLALLTYLGVKKLYAWYKARDPGTDRTVPEAMAPITS